MLYISAKIKGKYIGYYLSTITKQTANATKTDKRGLIYNLYEMKYSLEKFKISSLLNLYVNINYFNY